MSNVTSRFEEKTAQRKESKVNFSARIRSYRMLVKPDAENFNKNICNECGFRVRGEGHLEGAHHNNHVSVCHRGR